MRFRTTIKHKPGTELDICGQIITLSPDEAGYAEFDVDDQEVIDRLLEIPEGFKQIDSNPTVATPAGGQFILVGDDGQSVDLGAMDDEQLRQFATSNDIRIHGRAKGDTIRAAIVEAIKAGQ